MMTTYSATVIQSGANFDGIEVRRSDRDGNIETVFLDRDDIRDAAVAFAREFKLTKK